MEVFQVEAGFNIFLKYYLAYNVLVSNIWWKHIWLLCDLFKVDLHFVSKYQIPLLCEGDITFMYAIIQKGIYTIAETERINRVRKFK